MNAVGDVDRSRPRRSPAARPTDDHLLDSARAVFAERGFQQATMGAIAELADTTKPTLYAHFGDKDALFRAVFGREADTLRRWLLSAYASASDLPLEGLVHAYVTALFTYATEHPDSFRVLFDFHGADDFDPSRTSIVDTIVHQVSAQIRRHLADAGRSPGHSVELLAEMMVGLVGGAARHLRRATGLGSTATGDLATAFIMAAITNLDAKALDAADRTEPEATDTADP